MDWLSDFLATESAATWLWLGFGLVLLSGELVLPGIYLLWIGLSAIVVGLSLLVGADLSVYAQVGIFSLLSIGSVIVAVRYFKDAEALEGPGQVNLRGGQHVGRVCEVVEPIVAGRGHVKLGDSRWLASGPDAAIGTRVKIVALEGSMLIVEPHSTGDNVDADQMDQSAGRAVDHE